MGRPSRPLADRLWEKVDATGPCWLWTGWTNDGGYGVIASGGPGGGRDLRVHRVAYELLVGEIPPGVEPDHLCRIRHCVNPDHLELVTRRENLGRSPLRGSGQTHCQRGHAFDEANTYVVPGLGWRRCKRCVAERSTT